MTGDYGANYLVSMMRNTNFLDFHLLSCPSQLVVLRDFTIIDNNLSVNRIPASNVQASFMPYSGGIYDTNDNGIKIEFGLFFITK